MSIKLVIFCISKISVIFSGSHFFWFITQFEGKMNDHRDPGIGRTEENVPEHGQTSLSGRGYNLGATYNSCSLTEGFLRQEVSACFWRVLSFGILLNYIEQDEVVFL